MRKVGVLVSDAKLLYELLEALKADRVPFELVDPSDKVLRGIAVMLTTAEDSTGAKNCSTILCSLQNLDQCVKAAKALLMSKGKIRSLIIGIDPGSSTGIAVLADDAVIDSALVESPEEVADEVTKFIKFYPSSEVLVRIGHGDRTRRNRIFNSIWDLGIQIEIVDEHNTTTRTDHSDIDAAIEIALTPGYRPESRQPVSPSEGEISDIQRKSRIGSGGELTISRNLAASVARGEMSMEKAIERQRGTKRNGDQASKMT